MVVAVKQPPIPERLVVVGIVVVGQVLQVVVYTAGQAVAAHPTQLLVGL